MPIFAVLAIAGIALSVFGQVQGAQAEAEAKQRQAALQREQANQLNEMAARDVRLMRMQGDQVLGAQAAAYGNAGVSLEGSPLVAMEQTNSQIIDQIHAYEKDVQNKMKNLRSGATITEDYAGQMKTAGYINAGGTVLTGVGNYYAIKEPNSMKSKPPKKV